ncbi:MAG: hypothetical protein ACM3ZC_12025 [Bacteroidota bacterium]
MKLRLGTIVLVLAGVALLGFTIGALLLSSVEGSWFGHYNRAGPCRIVTLAIWPGPKPASCPWIS